MSPNPAVLTWPRPEVAQVVQFKKYSGAASPLSVTFDAPLTAGNFLVIAVRDVKTEGQRYTYSHPVTWNDQSIFGGGWYMSIASGFIEEGASSTVSVQAYSASNDALGVWELSGVSQYIGSRAASDNYVTSITLPGLKSAKQGDLGIIAHLIGSTSRTPIASMTNGTVDGAAQGSVFGHTSAPMDDNTISWDFSANEIRPLMCVFR